MLLTADWQVALVALLSAVPSISATVVELETRGTCVYYCGSTCYWQSDIDAALNQGYTYFEEGETVGMLSPGSDVRTRVYKALANRNRPEGSDEYPHQYNDYEGFTFPTAAPWYEFPILSSYKVYTGGSPGPDRVIFDSEGNFDALITHTGANGDDFVACTT